MKFKIDKAFGFAIGYFIIGTLMLILLRSNLSALLGYLIFADLGLFLTIITGLIAGWFDQ